MRFGVKPPCCRRTGDVRVRTGANSRAGAAAAQSPPFIALPDGAGPRRQWRRSCARSRTRATGGALTSPRPPRVARPSHDETSRPDHRATARAPVRQRSRLAAARGSTSWLVWSQSSSTVATCPPRAIKISSPTSALAQPGRTGSGARGVDPLVAAHQRASARACDGGCGFARAGRAAIEPASATSPRGHRVAPCLSTSPRRPRCEIR